MSICIENLSIKKNDNLILKNINFREEGTHNWVILGNSGSGKSTFLDVLGEKFFPTQGKMIRDKSKRVVSVSRDYSFHRIVGGAYQYYQQRYNAFDSLIGPTVYEVLQNQILPIGTVDLASVELPPLAYDPNWVNTVAKQLKITHLLDRKVTTLSNGETRRTLLAYWFLKKPDILLLDNPFAGLDTKSRAELKHILENLTETQIFLVADRRDIPKSFFNVIKLEKGELAYVGELDGLEHEKEVEQKDLSADLIKINELINLESADFEEALKLENVHVNYGEKAALTDINWIVRKGECWAVLGPNGSGKSTLMSLLTGDNPQSYKNKIYLFDRKRGSGESIWDIKKRIGFVSPELHLYFNKGTLVWKVVGSGFFDSMGLFRKLTDAQTNVIDAYLKLFGLLEFREKRMEQLSSGQQRLVLLLRALVKNPQLLVLDEPCQGLDYNQMVVFRETLNQVVKSQNKTLIYITHYEDEIPDCVTKRLYLDLGRVVKHHPILPQIA